jgi:hypothetical protein
LREELVGLYLPRSLMRVFAFMDDFSHIEHCLIVVV